MGGITNEETLRSAVKKGLRNPIRIYVLQVIPTTTAEQTTEQADKMSGVQMDSRTCLHNNQTWTKHKQDQWRSYLTTGPTAALYTGPRFKLSPGRVGVCHHISHPLKC